MIACGAAVILMAAQAADWHVWERLAGSINPLGLNSELRVETRSPFAWTQLEDPLLAETYWGAGGDLELSPAYLKAGPRVAFSPLAVLEVTAQARVLQYFGAFGTVLSFPTVDSPYDEATREDRADEAEADTGFAFDVRPELRVRLGRFVAANSWQIHAIAIPGEDTFIYEPYFDLLIGRRDLVFSSDLLTGAFVWNPPDDRVAILAAMWTYSRSAKSGDRSSSLGPLLAVKPLAGTKCPTVIAIARAYLEDNLQDAGSLYVVIATQWWLP